MSDESEATYCNARLRQNGHDPDELPKREPSGEWAGEGYCKRQTETPRCRMHGGANTTEGRPPSHGLHSQLRSDLREYVEQAASMDAPGDLKGELAVVRGLLYRRLQQSDGLDSDLIDDAHKLLSELRRYSDTLHKQMTRERLTKDEEEKLFNTFAKILRKYVPDEDDRESAIDELEQAVSAGSGRPALESGQ